MLAVSSWQGPLPSPQHLAEFEKIHPGFAERILAMTEQQAQHRMQLEKTVVETQLVQSARGQFFALVIGVSSLAAATILGGPYANTIAANTIGVAGMTVLAVAFISGRKQQRENLQEKRRRLESAGDEGG